MNIRRSSPRHTLSRLASYGVLSFSLAAGLACFMLASAVGVRSAAAQARGPATRVVHGMVEDAKGAGIKGAVVYLKDNHSTSVKSAITDEAGTYRFVQLSLNADYEIWAQSDTKKSPTKSISSFDSKPDITIILHIDK